MTDSQTRVLSTYPKARACHSGVEFQVWSFKVVQDGRPWLGGWPVRLGEGVTEAMAWQAAASKLEGM